MSTDPTTDSGIAARHGLGRPVEAKLYHAGAPHIREEVERAAKGELRLSNLSFKGYQATIEVAGKLAASTMQMCTEVAGDLNQGDSERIACSRDVVIRRFQAGVRIMQEVADLTFNRKWHCGRGHDEECAKIRAAGEIAATFADSSTQFDEKKLIDTILQYYKGNRENLRKESIAEEHWGGLVLAASLGAREVSLGSRPGNALV
ncbi:MAG: hypothetical protein DCC75_10910 [Proteobacteria bacterium]|nr:MAG: hypothetical protein DCC75_10910 [Pseudomonadota bacterium]